jgi:hypothetical protein
MPEGNAESKGLAFRHAYGALALAAALLALILGLSWWDGERRARRVQAWQAKLCGPLPSALDAAFDSFALDTLRAPPEAREAVPLLLALLGEPDEHPEVRVIFRSKAGKREMRRWSDELVVPDDATTFWGEAPCAVELDSDRTRLIRRLRNRAGVDVWFALEVPHH